MIKYDTMIQQKIISEKIYCDACEKKYHIEIEHALIERNFEKAEQLLHDDIATIGKELFL